MLGRSAVEVECAVCYQDLPPETGDLPCDYYGTVELVQPPFHTKRHRVLCQCPTVLSIAHQNNHGSLYPLPQET